MILIEDYFFGDQVEKGLSVVHIVTEISDHTRDVTFIQTPLLKVVFSHSLPELIFEILFCERFSETVVPPPPKQAVKLSVVESAIPPGCETDDGSLAWNTCRDAIVTFERSAQFIPAQSLLDRGCVHAGTHIRVVPDSDMRCGKDSRCVPDGRRSC